MKEKEKKTTDVTEARKHYIRRCIARGLYKHEVLNACRVNKLFRKGATDKGPKGRGVAIDKLARSTIESHYYNPVRQELRERVFSATEEVALAYDRLMLAYRMAVRSRRPSDMVRVQREINRMLGLRKTESDGTDPELIFRQIQEMGRSVGSLTEGGEQDAA